MRTHVLVAIIVASLAAALAGGSFLAGSLRAQTPPPSEAPTPPPSPIPSIAPASAPALLTSVSQPLFAGWNFAPWRMAGCEPIREALGNILALDIVNVVALFQPQGQSWRLFDPDAPDVVNTFSQLCQGDIGILHVSENGQWVQQPPVPSDPQYSGSLAVGASVVVANTGGDCLNARAAPGGDIVACLPEGFVGSIDDGPLYLDGYWWWHIAGQGWSAEEYLRPLGDGAPPTTEPAPSGGFIWPVSGPITDGFGVPRGNGYHKGIDIDVPDGSATPVAAAAAGEVSLAEWSAGLGNHVIIDHEDGFQTVYAHLSSIAVKVGQKVSQGETIGYTGCTGYCTGEHLHFEIHKDGTPLDPLPYLP